VNITNRPLKYAVVIPARYQSSRFPGKPLVDLAGKPMIQHVWERSCDAVGHERVYIATDDNRIRNVCQNFGSNVIMTSSACHTGTDRLAEANKVLNCDFIVNVQGDEPLINPEVITLVIEKFLLTGNVINAYCKINTEKEFRSLTVPKVVVSKSEQLLYMSRSAIPLTKEGQFKTANKQVCVYAFSKFQLEFFASTHNKTPLEQIEDIEILRFLEGDFNVDMVEVPSGSLAVDVPEDIDKVLEHLSPPLKQ
jgi:3-deoxy-manno-octulosonate cytidylyltransferase (CMP-KDO synthetase)